MGQRQEVAPRGNPEGIFQQPKLLGSVPGPPQLVYDVQLHAEEERQPDRARPAVPWKQ